MLQYQRGEYCICIWDGEHTRLSKALESLGKYAEDKNDHQGYAVAVQTFGQGTIVEKARKVLEKASNVQGALLYEGHESNQVIYALAETVTACLNLVEALGCNAEEFQKQLNLVKESNARKEH